MKLLALRFHNLASLAEEKEIRFDTEPLRSAGLIAITGNTGAGKSTILDAMCLALYNEIPRFKNSGMSKQTKLKDNQSGETHVLDTRQILSRGATMGYAEVEFIALDQKKYISRWQVRRSRNQKKGALQKVERSVCCIDENNRLLTDKASECTPLIEQLIGLSFSQFTRAVLLAQSDVGAFLKANDQERADLLEYLTDSKIFSFIGKKAFEKAKFYAEKIKDEERRLGDVQFLSDEDLAAYQAQKMETEQQLKQHQQQQNALVAEQQKVQTVQNLTRELATKQQYAVQLEQQQPVIEQKQQQLKQYQQFEQIRPVLLMEQDAKQQISQKKQQYTTLQQQYDESKQKLVDQEQVCSRNQQQWQNLQNYLHSIKADLQEAVSLQDKRNFIAQQVQQDRNTLDDLQSEQTNIQQQQQQEQSQYHHLQREQQQLQQFLQTPTPLAIFDQETHIILDKIARYQKDYQSLQNLMKDQTAPINMLKLAQVFVQVETEYYDFVNEHGDMNRLNEQIQQCHVQQSQIQQNYNYAQALSKTLQAYMRVIEQQHNEQQRLLKLNDDILQEGQILNRYKNDYEQKQAQLATLRETLQQQRLIFAENVQDLRQLLQENQPCMVCGSTEHPFLKHQFEQSLFDLQQKQEQQAQQDEQQALQAWQQQQQKYTEISQQQQFAQKEIHSFEQEKQQLNVQIEQDIQQLSMAEYSLAMWQNLTKSTEGVDSLLQKLVTTQQENRAKNNDIEQRLTLLNEQLGKYQQKKDNLDRQVVCKQQFERVEVSMKEIFQAFTESEQEELNRKWQVDGFTQANEWKHMIEQRQTMLNDDKQIQERLHKQQNIIAQFDIQLQSIAKQLSDKQLILQQNQQQDEQIQHHLSQYMEQFQQQLPLPVNSNEMAMLQRNISDAKQWQHCVQQILGELQQLYADSQSQKENCLQQVNALNVNVEQIHSQIKTLTQQQLSYTQQIEQWLAQYQQFTMGKVAEYMELNTAVLIEQFEKKVQEYQQQHSRVKGEIDSLQTQLTVIEIKPEYAGEHGAEQLQQQISALQSSLEQIETLYRECCILLEKDQQARQKYQQHEQEIAKIKEEWLRWDKISQLIGCSKGEKFQKIAQQHNLDILLEYANVQLQQLSTRYELKRIENSLSLSITDREMNDVERSVVSLSGGESFLVSLALALAIAQMASGSVKLETLFIDEGFGTLDQESLQVVMGALELLQGQGRKIVLISHIQEIQERIPVKIKVEAQGSGKSIVSVGY